MTTLADQLAAFAKIHGGTVRHGPQLPKPHREIVPCIGRTQLIQRSQNRDPYLEYTDDYSLWKQGQ